MAYAGYLLKLGDYIVPHKYIKYDTYQAYTNKQTVNPWYDANGFEHYTAVDLKALKVEFQTPDGLTNNQLEDFFSHIRANFTNSRDEKLMITAYSLFWNTYFTQLGYIKDITDPKIRFIRDGEIYYNPISIVLVGGVEE